VGQGSSSTLLERKAGLRAVQRLDLRLFVDAENHGMGGRRHIEADDIAQLFGERRVVRELEAAPAMRRETMGVSETLCI
jgi:hypothetical protein